MNLKSIIGHMFRKKYERDVDLPKFKPYFYRVIGVNNSEEYDSDLRLLKNKCEEYKGTSVIFEGSIKMSGEIELIQYINNELGNMDIYNMKNQDIIIFNNREMNFKFLKALDVVIPIAVSKENFFNESVRNNFITKLIVWCFLWVKDLDFESDILNKCIYYGEIQRHEIYFLMLLYNMGFDVLYLNPVKEEYWGEIDTESKLIKEMGIANIETFQTKVMRGKDIENYETITKMIQKEVEEELFVGTGIYRPWQFRDGYTKSILLDTILEDIYVYWKEPTKVRSGFKVQDRTITVPCMFYKIDGVYKDKLEYQKLIQHCINDENTIFLNNSEIFNALSESENIYEIMFCQLSNGEFDIEELKKITIYRYSKYSTELQNFILNKFNETIMSRHIYSRELTKEEILEFLARILTLKEDIIKVIDNFDFTGAIPKVVVFLEKERELSEEIQLLLGYFHVIGMDIAFFNPSGMCNISSIIESKNFNICRLDTMEYDIEYSKIINLKPKTKGYFSRFLGV